MIYILTCTVSAVGLYHSRIHNNIEAVRFEKLLNIYFEGAVKMQPYFPNFFTEQDLSNCLLSLDSH